MEAIEQMRTLYHSHSAAGIPTNTPGGLNKFVAGTDALRKLQRTRPKNPKLRPGPGRPSEFLGHSASTPVLSSASEPALPSISGGAGGDTAKENNAPGGGSGDGSGGKAGSGAGSGAMRMSIKSANSRRGPGSAMRPKSSPAGPASRSGSNEWDAESVGSGRATPGSAGGQRGQRGQLGDAALHKIPLLKNQVSRWCGRRRDRLEMGGEGRN